MTVFGLGEAGSLIAGDLVSQGIQVQGYDPAPVPTPAGVVRHADPVNVVQGVDVVLAITAAADAETALTQALSAIPTSALYADLSTGSGSLKQNLANIASNRGLAFADVALMSTVPGKGLRVPALTSGNGALRFVEVLAPLGMPVSVVGAKPGDAATRKLLRSVMMKGLAGVVVEAMRAGEKAGCADWLWRNLAGEITSADELLLSRLVRGTALHHLRRHDEMVAAAELLQDLGVNPIMTRATIDNLRSMQDAGMPHIPDV